MICLSSANAANVTLNPSDAGGINSAVSIVANGSDVNNTITLNPGTYNKTTDRNNNITFSGKNLIIQGNGSTGSVIIDAQKLGRMFTITGNSNITFINISFINGNSLANGGSIYNTGKLTITNCKFFNNTADQINGSGGAIYNLGILAIDNSIFINNNALQINGTGGAIYNAGVNSRITNSIFTNNSAYYRGGAIRNINGHNFTVDSCNFTNNTFLTESGGAIASQSSDNMTIINSLFIENNANSTRYAGAIDGYYCFNLNIINCTFINNSANYGGAILNNGTITLSENIMSDNVAVLGQMIYNNGSMGVLNLTYINNSTLTVLNGSTITIYATLTDDMGNTVTGQNIRIYINGILGGTLIQNIESIEGYVSFNLTIIGEDGDEFPVNGTYDGIGDYPLIINEGLISVFVIDPYNITKIATNSTISAKNTTVGKTTNITGIATDENGNILANIELSVIVDGKTYTVTTNSNGEWTLTYIPTKVGNIAVSVQLKGNDTHNGFTNKAKLNVAKRNIIVIITTEENDDGSITVIVNATYEDDGTPVIDHPVDFILDGKIIGTGITNKNGISKITIPANKINGKTHKITALVYGDDNSNSGKATTTFARKNPVDPNPNKTSNNPAVTAAMKETGIPINLIVLVFLSCLGIVIRKNK